MKFKHIHFIINPAAGKKEPILSFINEAFDETNIDWDITVTKRGTNIGKIASELIGKTDLIVVYGGDGCVTEVAGALAGSDTPLGIIPGGTANVMSKELGIPQDAVEALALLKAEDLVIRQIDMGTVNNMPFLLRINMGIMADMVLQTDRELKDNIGQLAYGITAIKTIAEATPVEYTLKLDGQEIKESGVLLTITNSGHIGIGDFALQPGISITDGKLDVILLKDASLLSLIKTAGSTLLQNKTDAVKHWQVEEVLVDSSNEFSFVCDDREEKAASLIIRVKPGSIKIVALKPIIE
jgi:diacylglycerol kinase (ATP)